MGVSVSPAHQRRGYGSRLVENVQHELTKQASLNIEVHARENEPAGLAFMEKHGYPRIANTFESVLDVATFDINAFEAKQLGLRTFSFAETAMSEAEERKLWDLNSETSRDEPKNDANFRPTFDEFKGSVIGASWFDPAGQFFAADGNEWVGMSASGRVFGKEFSNLFTGVRRSHRGRGIAFALKLRATEWAKESGAVTIRTNNDSRNAAMLAVNSKLGYVAEAGWIVGRKSVGRESNRS